MIDLYKYAAPSSMREQTQRALSDEHAPTKPFSPRLYTRRASGRHWDKWAAFTMKRFIITVLIATVLHAVACILVPPFEFAPTRAACFFWACRSGIVVFPIAFAVLLLPLRAGLRHFMPQSTDRTHAVVAAAVLFVVVAVWILARQLSGVPSPPYEHGYLSQWIFWPLFVCVIAVSFFWPFSSV